jgi:hypothetical protein
MPSTEAPTWWADVQQEREDLTGGRRPAEDWLGEDIDFVPRRRVTRADRPSEEELHGVFVPTSMAIELERIPPRDEELEVATPADVAQELRHLRAADDPFATPPPPAGVRRTVQIKGRPGAPAVPSLARRHRPRTAHDRIGPRPDRIALWAVVLGAILIILAATSASSQAAVRQPRATHAHAAAKVVNVVHRAPRLPR